MGAQHWTDVNVGHRLSLHWHTPGCGGQFILANPSPAREHRAIILYSSAVTTSLDNEALADGNGRYRWARYRRAMTLHVMWSSLIA